MVVVMTKAMIASASRLTIARIGRSVTFTLVVGLTIAGLHAVTDTKCHQLLLNCH